ncbi:helix-turn-helix domain-containing protein [Chitinophaga sp. S165]|uniref:IS66 family insertion sequence element accessory protein TnpA n=1 Tax=Chitinophaga sp. S165 TaxID=2135462 RepID=UPI000D715DA3|nr:helix-turn-helix domain-containing protein [Chitinophaga sp. S165]PWV55513.1 hypothetical protein C7475_10119 [Chitinophaga sp. S165]
MQKTIVKGNDHPATKADMMKEIVSRYPASGKTVAQYCAANKIKEKTFYYWLRKYRKINTAVLTKPAILPINIDSISIQGEYQPLFAELMGIKI